MITTRTVPRTRRLLIAAFALSLLVHLFGGALWARAAHVVARLMHRAPEQLPQEQEVATSDVVHLEKRTIPQPAQRSRTQPSVRPVARLQPRALPVASRRALLARPAPERPARKPDRPVPDALPEIAHRAAHAPRHSAKPDVATSPGAGTTKPATTAHRAALSATQIAQLNAQFTKTLAATHVDLATIQKQTEERPVTSRRYPLQFTGMQANLQRGEGYISPTTPGQRIGGSVWYYTHYTYMWPDGHLEDDDIPWPFRFPAQRDLFALHVHLIPLQPPPAGFHLTRPLKPFLARFVQRAGAG